MTTYLPQLDRAACRDLDRVLATEWISADGVGGFASSTPLLCPTRRYHGLLVAVPPGSAKRHLFLARFDEIARIGKAEHRLSVTNFDGVLAPGGGAWVESFELRPHPTTCYRIGEIQIEREVTPLKGSPTVLCRYTARGGAVELELRPLLACREADALTFANDVADDAVSRIDGGIVAQPYPALPAVSITLGGAEWEFAPAVTWYRGIRYAADLARGYDGHEDQLSPGRLSIQLADGESVVVAATIEAPVADPEREWQRACAAQASARTDAIARSGDDGVRARIDAAADDFLYRTPSGRVGICAGYPWFGEWGRDTFIALPGLTIARGQLGLCRRVLEGALPFLDDGLLPNIYGRAIEDSHYGSVDAALWFARAAELFATAATGADDTDFVLEVLRPALREIAQAYRDGTGLGVGADDGMLIVAGGPDLNATWMDAHASDGPVTPRDGCAVEINALWYALLDHLAELERVAGARTEASAWRKLCEQAGATFVERLWLEDGRRLADRWVDGGADRRIRPNMVLAAALVRSPLTKLMRRGVVACATERLLTPRGLRTLAPDDLEYRARYAGGLDGRDRAYHQGTVWPWLLGFYTEACLRTRGAADVSRLRALWAGFAPELDRAGLDHISEVFDGNEPHAPGGTIAQAWNSAEYLRSAALLDGWPS